MVTACLRPRRPSPRLQPRPSRARVRATPRLVVLQELVPLGVLNRRAPIKDLLLCRLQAGEVLARHLHFYATVHLWLPFVLPDVVDGQLQLLALHGHPGQSASVWQAGRTQRDKGRGLDD